VPASELAPVSVAIAALEAIKFMTWRARERAVEILSSSPLGKA